MKRRLVVAAVAISAAWAISIPLRIESYILTTWVTLVMYTPLTIAALIAIQYRRSPLGAATLLTLGCVICLRIAVTSALLWRFGFQSRFGLWIPVLICLPIA